MQTNFYHSPLSLEDMFKDLAEKNKISCFSLPVFKQSPDPIFYENPALLNVHDFERISTLPVNQLKDGFKFSRMGRKSENVVGISSLVEYDRPGNEGHMRQLDLDFSGDIENGLR
ncbi:hypothetical protein COU57_04880 [Candidatus Pacearchaeota archaeon CG10_big_fil_rev_8_21_14_0_10_32_14]|nr:MAG: hypothetical protein COU57_04880 [Candidatus Pacearchaeota archaeon CG10_big_fil_rev_8_21_14_0_10_32_14]